ncbi:MAG: NAD(P)H-binding protein [Pseudomonadota bacterium]
MPLPPPSPPKRVMLLGATGTIGQATAQALLAAGHQVTCFVRQPTPAKSEGVARALSGATCRFGEVTDPDALANHGFRGERFDALVTCLASRNGAPKDAWAIDYTANSNALTAAQQAGVSHVIVLSALCVQKPRLAFQKAKLTFEQDVIASGLTYSIVRPTAFFKSVSGQIDRVKRGKAFLVFGDGSATPSKPISDRDLADFLVLCLSDPELANRVLPIGGPGPAISPREMGEELFRLAGRSPRFQSVPAGLFRSLARVLDAVGTAIPALQTKAEFLRIAHYYGTEAMLLWDHEAGRYDADATPSFGRDRLFDFYRTQMASETRVDLGAHAIFDRNAASAPASQADAG